MNAGAKLDAVSPAMNFLYVPDRKVLGGNLGLSITVPDGGVDIRAGAEVQAQGFSREVSGWGMGDVIPRVQLGSQRGDFANTVYLEVITASGFWEKGFMPIGRCTVRASTPVGHSPGRRSDRSCKSVARRAWNEFHFEWAVGLECVQGLVLGVVDYDYRQLNGDSGSGDPVGPFRGSLDAIGPGLSYSTIIDKRPVTFNLRYYHDYEFDKHFHGDDDLGNGPLLTLRLAWSLNDGAMRLTTNDLTGGQDTAPAPGWQNSQGDRRDVRHQRQLCARGQTANKHGWVS